MLSGHYIVAASLYISVLAVAAHGDGSAMEEEELLGLFEVMGSLLEDPTWAQFHPLPCTETPWPGVECEIDQNPSIFHVTKIHIGPDILTPPCKPSATIPNSLHKLPYLKTLSLFSCFTTVPLSLPPSLFASSSSLEHLSLLSNPGLTGEIPSTLSHISTLKVLSLAQNSLEGEIPRQIGGLLNLEQLDLSYNNLSGSIPGEIGGLRILKILDLSKNGFTGNLPDSVGELQNLQKIDLSSNNLQGMLPQELGKLKRLTLLDFSQNSLTGPIPESLSGLEQLQYFIVEDNPLNAEIPPFIGSLLKLTVISLSKCGLRGPIPSSLSNLKNLTALSLDKNNLNGTVPQDLGTLQNLGLLNLSQNQLSGELGFPQEFIQKLGVRLDLRGNNGLCTRQMLQKFKKNQTSRFLHSYCFGTRFAGSNRSSDSEHPNDSKKMKPSWYQGDMGSSSSSHGLLHQKVVFSSLLWTVILSSVL
ncbi:PREDICTED: piriformospora indica-insensitive protein 2-like isoform X2 [Ipomoea nil]|uniref:piriformospora indica-insensitive protein 2-like isoform X2 n=1 Tax=Ipomoea nil TaxID=35883 RepID=UPI000900DC28|nr:PREDICTED: piriformospora indica-insensitive protein 2-like isoform X2 [Ipomoea nil]